MSNARRSKLLLVLAVCLASLSLGLVGPGAASASTSSYCGGWLPGNGGCVGAARCLYQTYGWGDQYAACVGIESGWAYSCAPGAGTGVYSQQLASNRWSRPVIVNGNLKSSNFVHGVALTH